MSDEIVRLAVMAAGAVDRGWDERVVALVPRIASLMREPRDEADPTSLVNVARKVSEASVFKAEYRGHEFDENTQRIFVKLHDPKSQDGDYLDADGNQTVRTEPMWSPTGRAMRKTLESMTSGQAAVCYRYTEQIDKKRKMGLLIHLEPLGRSRPAEAAQAPPPAAAPAGRTDTAGDTTPPAVSPSPDGKVEDLWREIEIIQEDMSSVAKIRAARQLREENIMNFITPDTEEKCRRSIAVLTEWKAKA